MPFDILDDLFDRDRREQRGRRSGIGGLLDRILGGDRDRRGDDRYDDDRARYRRDDDDDDRWERRDRDDRVYDRDDLKQEDGRSRRRGRDNDLFDFD